ncbi:MAG: C1 family peptidase [Malacoplasma sp.]|nr:C1 family peptidase [Malacoplasma sp.]
MKRNIDIELIEKFNNNICQKNISKTSNILFNTSIYQASYNALKFNELNHSNFAINLIGLPVENQKKSGRCWLFAATNFMREQIAKKLDLEDFSLSNAYLAFWDKIERSNFFLEAIINNIDSPSDDRLVSHFLSTGIEDGGQWDMAVNLIEKYGIVPYDVMKDTYHAGDTQKINYLLNWKLRDFAADLRKEKDKSYDNLSNIKKIMMKDIFKLLQSFYGKIPTNFDFEYSVEIKQDSQYVNSYKDLNKKMIVDKNLTPQTFYEKYVDLKLNKFISIIHAPQKSKDFYKFYSFQYLNNVIEGKPIMHCNVEIEVFKYLIVNQLKNGLPVWFGSDVGWFRDWISGNWDDQLFDITNLFNTSFELSKGDQLSYRTSFMTHAMLIVGVNLDLDKLKEFDDKQITNYTTLASAMKNLNINRWRIQNSWGDDLGDYGYWTISDSWFDKYTYQAVVLKSDLENILKKLDLPSLSEQEVINLDPWDPIGTLA